MSLAVMVIPNDVQILGHLSSVTATVPPASVDNASVKPGADIDPSKLGHYHEPTYGQAGSATSETRAFFRARSAGVVLEFLAGSIAIAVGDSTVTIDIRKGGSTILSAVITLNSSRTARVAVAGTLTGGAVIAAGDLLEVVTVATVGTGTLPTGVFWSALIKDVA